MKPHNELPRAGVEDDLGAFEDAASRDLTGWIRGDSQGDAFVLPSVKISGGIDMNADLGRISELTRDLVFTEPVKQPVAREHAAAVRIDVLSLVIEPQLNGPKGVCGNPSWNLTSTKICRKEWQAKGAQADSEPCIFGLAVHLDPQGSVGQCAAILTTK
ncbi:MAG: hypothetical protein ABSD29_09740 [Verrucomicrobiota bacterium]